MARGTLIVCVQCFLKSQMITHYVNTPVAAAGAMTMHIPKFVFRCFVQVYAVVIMDIPVDYTAMISKPMVRRVYHCVGPLNNWYLLPEMITTYEIIYICPLPQHIVGHIKEHITKTMHES